MKDDVLWLYIYCIQYVISTYWVLLRPAAGVAAHGRLEGLLHQIPLVYPHAHASMDGYFLRLPSPLWSKTPRQHWRVCNKTNKKPTLRCGYKHAGPYLTPNAEQCTGGTDTTDILQTTDIYFCHICHVCLATHASFWTWIIQLQRNFLGVGVAGSIIILFLVILPWCCEHLLYECTYS